MTPVYFDLCPINGVDSVFGLVADEEIFRQVYIDFGVTVWNNGEIDIAPKYLYDNSVPASSDIA